MKRLSFYSHSSEETVNFAKRLARFLRKGQVLGFFGNLGSGKTTFIKGLAKGLGLKDRINSPSFVILKVYSFKENYSKIKRANNKKLLLYHFDLYRLTSLKELEDIGYEDFISNSGICVIEWADKAKKLLPKHYLKIQMQIKGENIRLINLIGFGVKYEDLISQMRPRFTER
ncbi:MAG: tRNA (adenosine(37)-N6)-threonylcarbamoyltransferase complex ATPase subunit type 1 TsaE [Candidatus Omnitrophica bacterium]|nr:tRNA (adenosine(37)-N6)-threonylcarbamoyltransferase complex ATPase subunit type 1 TsaE [Candidatus Omnitrophota bacterium]